MHDGILRVYIIFNHQKYKLIQNQMNSKLQDKFHELMKDKIDTFKTDLAEKTTQAG